MRTWLKEHPTFEVVGTNNLGALQIGKTITTIQTQIPGKTTKSALLSPAKGQNLPKMTYAKVPGSKQMILTAGNKKIYAYLWYLFSAIFKMSAYLKAKKR